MAIISATYKYNVVYVYSIDDDRHRGALKIGKTEIDTDPKTGSELTPNCAALRKAADKRIKEQTQTSAVAYNLVYAIKAHFTDDEGKEYKYSDTDIHAVLLASGYHRHYFPDLEDQAKEWFDVDLDTVKKAIEAIKQGRSSIEGSEKKPSVEIHFREEQESAINRTLVYFKAGRNRKMLWNAKMRFGKTLCSLELIRRCQFKRTLILTHRPAVKSQWFDDYGNIKFENYEYGSKPSANQKSGQKFVGQKFDYLQKCGKNFIYFASMQDLRGSWKADGTLKKNGDVFKTKWDLVIIDEAHEGTQTDLGKQVIVALNAQKPRFLYLSGTPYNILAQFKSEEIYTWDYVMEQEAKANWPKTHPDEPNPYEGLAHLNILTYNLGTVFDNYNHSEEDYFEFSEFFRTWEGDEDNMPTYANVGDFVHEADVNRFLDLLCKEDETSNYPYSTDEYRKCFLHTLWVLPGVAAAAALSKMLHAHKAFFQNFIVVNVAGEGDKMDTTDDEKEKWMAAKSFEDKVRKAIANPEHKPTITLTCYSGRMTTGVTIEEWTGVFMLAGGYNGNIAPYMQTIFRVQSPIKHHDYIKKECYAFDFAPDRTLTVINEYIRQAKKKGPVGNGKKAKGLTIEDFTRYCSIIAIEGSKTVDYDAKRFIQTVNRIYADHVIRNGGKDRRMYVGYDEIEDNDVKSLEAIAKAMKDSGSKSKDKTGTSVVITEEGMTGDNGAAEPTPSSPSSGKGNNRGKKKKPKDPEKERREMVYATLNQITIRLPLMVFGALDDVKTVSFDKFIADIDEDSWNEFMPKGLTKDLFMNVSHLYNNDVFIAMAAEIIDRTRKADALPITQRTQEIANILSQFHYPDNETVLTPWNVVCMHMNDTLGGWDFFDDRHKKGFPLPEPRFIDRGKVTKEVFSDPQTKILELNSKSGVYPLYLAYSVFQEQSKPVKNMFGETMPLSDDGKRRVWDRVVEENIYVVCKTPMAEKITRRVLAGYNKRLKLNTVYIDDIISRMKDKKLSPKLIEELTLPKTYGNRQKKKPMKFNAIVSNPPYMIKDGGAGASATPVYNHFVDCAKKLSPGYISIIMPAKWYNDGKGLAKFRTDMLTDRHIEKLVDFVDEHVCFPGVDVAGGVCYFLWDKAHDGDCQYSNIFKGQRLTINRNLAEGDRFIRYVQAIDMLDKVKAEKYYSSIVSSRKPFGLATDVTPLATGDITLETSQGKGPYDSKLITVGKDMIYKWKVCISRLTAEHAGQADSTGRKKIISSLHILEPGEICTETYLVVDAFDTEEESRALLKYLCTRFARFLVSLLAATQQISKDKFSYVPVQDFASNDDIDWRQPVNAIDRQLYQKYGFDDNDVHFIEQTIKPME